MFSTFMLHLSWKPAQGLELPVYFSIFLISFKEGKVIGLNWLFSQKKINK